MTIFGIGESAVEEDPESGSVLLVDELPFKRAFVSEFLKPWAFRANLSVIASDLDDVMALKHSSCGCRLVILSIGAESLSSARMLAAHKALTAAHKNRPIVVLGDRPDLENVEQALQMGVAGYIPTSLAADVAVAALDFVLAGGRYFPPDAFIQMGEPHDAPPKEPRQLPLISAEPREQPRRPREPSGSGHGTRSSEALLGPNGSSPIIVPGELTSRQQEVLDCLQRARSNKEIARELCVSEATVKVHVRQVMKKLGALNRTHAAVLAVNLVSHEEAAGSNVAPFLGGKPALQHALRR